MAVAGGAAIGLQARAGATEDHRNAVAAFVNKQKPTFTGHFTVWFGDNDNLRNGTETFTFSVHGVGSDGSVINVHEVAHVTFDANGDPKIEFDKLACR